MYMNKWKKCKLGDALNFRRGHDLPKSSMIEGEVPVAGSNGVIGYHNVSTPISPCITIGRSGNVGTPYIYDKCWAHNTVLYIDDYKGNHPRYLYYLLKNLPLASFGGGSAVPTLNRNHIHPIEISLPPLTEQKRIADILSAIDDKIELNCRINANLEQQAQALYKSWFGEISSNITLQEITLNITDGVHNTVKDDCSGEYLLLSCKNIVGGHLVIGPNERRINKETFDKLRKRTRLSEGDILVSTVGTVGEIVILLDPPANVEFQRSVGIIKPNISKASPYYIYCALKDKQEALKHTAHGAVQQCIFIGDLKNFEIPYSYSKKLIEFDTIVSPMFNQLTINHRESNYLTQLRDTLLPKLMSGEITV